MYIFALRNDTVLIVAKSYMCQESLELRLSKESQLSLLLCVLRKSQAVCPHAIIPNTFERLCSCTFSFESYFHLFSSYIPDKYMLHDGPGKEAGGTV